MANPTAIAVKLLLIENSECGRSSSYGFHTVSATTLPWRSSIAECGDDRPSSAWMSSATAGDGSTLRLGGRSRRVLWSFLAYSSG